MLRKHLQKNNRPKAPTETATASDAPDSDNTPEAASDDDSDSADTDDDGW